MKMEVWRGQKSSYIEGWRYFGRSWGTSSSTWRDLAEISGEDGRKMSDAGAKLAASCDRDGSR